MKIDGFHNPLSILPRRDTAPKTSSNVTQAVEPGASYDGPVATPLELKRPGLMKRSVGMAKSLAKSGALAATTLAGALTHPLGTLALVRSLVRAPFQEKSFILGLQDYRKGFADLTKLAVQKISDPVEKSFGLSVAGLLRVEEQLHEILAPIQRGASSKDPSRFLERLVDSEGRAPLVHLGPNKETAARWLEALATVMGPNPELDETASMADRAHTARYLLSSYALTDPVTMAEQTANKILSRELETAQFGSTYDILQQLTPPEGVSRAEAQYVLDYLLAKMKSGEPPVYIDLDGQLAEPTPTEAIANQTLASVYSVDPSDIRQLNLRLATHEWSGIKYLLGEKKPYLAQTAKSIKSLLSPQWDKDKEHALGWRPFSKDVDLAISEFGSGRTAEDLTDLVVSLDRDLVTGGQSYWVKLLRESGPEKRPFLLAQVAKAFGQLHSEPPRVYTFADLKDESDDLILDDYDKTTGFRRPARRYDRAEALTDVVDRTLDGLGSDERKLFKEQIKSQLKNHAAEIQERENALRREWPYVGVSISDLLSGLETQDSLAPTLTQLKALEESALRAGPTPDWKVRASELARHRLLLTWLAGQSDRYQEPTFALRPDFKGTYAVSEFYTGTFRVKDLDTAPPSAPDAGLRTSLVLEGGGGKGFAYPDYLDQVESSLHDSIKVDEFVGTSAGALTAGLLAAGYETKELKAVMSQMNFLSFNSDFFQLQSCSDPKVRGMDRTGLFSMKTMYTTLYRLMKEKLGIQGDSPITFRDLPLGLKLTGVVISTDLPDDHPLRDQIGEDGQIVFSRETTPDFDVLGCMVASAAVPAYFNSPQLKLAEVGPDGRQRHYRMQLMDGGVTNNLPLNLAGQGEEKAASLTMPVRFQSAETQLTTLSFDNSNSGPVDAVNRDMLQKDLPGVKRLVEKLSTQGYQRLVLGLNLSTPAEQPAPIIQGLTREDSEILVAQASAVGLTVMEPESAQTIVTSNLPKGGFFSKMVSYPANLLLDGSGDDNRFTPSLLGSSKYRASRAEVNRLADVLGATVASQTVAGQIYKGFERQAPSHDPESGWLISGH